MFDAAVDRYGEMFFFGGLVYYYRDHDQVLFIVLAAIVGSFMVSYATAKAEAMGVAAPRGAMRRGERARLPDHRRGVHAGRAARCSPTRRRWRCARLPIILALAIVAVVANISVVQRLRRIAALLREREAAKAARAAARVRRRGDRHQAGRSRSGRSRARLARARTPAARRGGFWQWMRHHAASIVATVVDYVVMIVVRRARCDLAPGAGHARSGRSRGAVTNFTLGRRFTYQRTDVRPRGQAWRYALVSAASLGLNTAGEYLFHDVLAHRVSRGAGHHLGDRQQRLELSRCSDISYSRAAPERYAAPGRP